MKKSFISLLALCTLFILCACEQNEQDTEGKTDINMIVAQYGTKTADWWAE